MSTGKGFANTIVTLDAVSRRIEQGLAYYSVADDPQVAQDADFNMVFRTPESPVVGASFQYLYGSAASLSIFEGAILSDPGTPVPPMNFRRTEPIRQSKSLTFQDPTITDDGDRLFPDLILPGGTSGKNTVGGISETLFLILRPSTDYLVRLTNNSNTDSSMTITATYAEIEGRLSSGT